MPSSPELLSLSKSEDWLQLRMPEIQRILDTLKDPSAHVIGDNVENLNNIHGVVSNIRGRQEYIKTYLIRVIGMELEVKRFLALAKSKYKDAIGPAFVKYSELVSAARSYEEKENRIREFVPQIKEREEWESISEQVSLLKEAVDLAYQDLSKASMTASLQVNVIRQQVLTGEIKVQFGKFTPQTLLEDAALSSPERHLLHKLPGDGKPSGEFDLGI
jgi:hypothetical protein